MATSELIHKMESYRAYSGIRFAATFVVVTESYGEVFEVGLTRLDKNARSRQTVVMTRTMDGATAEEYYCEAVEMLDNFHKVNDRWEALRAEQFATPEGDPE